MGRRAYKRPRYFVEFDTGTTAAINLTYPVHGTSTEWLPVFSNGGSTAIAVGPARDQRQGPAIVCTGLDFRAMFKLCTGPEGKNDDTIWTIMIAKSYVPNAVLLQGLAGAYGNYSAAINDRIWDTADIASGGWAEMWHRQKDSNKKRLKRQIKIVWKKQFIMHQERPALTDVVIQYIKAFKRWKARVEFETDAVAYPVNKGQYWMTVYPSRKIVNVDDPDNTGNDIAIWQYRTRWYWQNPNH